MSHIDLICEPQQALKHLHSFYNLIKACDAQQRAHQLGTVASGAAPAADLVPCSNWLPAYYFKRPKPKDLCHNQTDVGFPDRSKIDLIMHTGICGDMPLRHEMIKQRHETMLPTSNQ